MIFAAGLGTRLAPLTDHRPKALVKFLGKTMLENVADRLTAAGCDRLVINVHHHSAMMKYFIGSHTFGAPVSVSDESDLLLDTGGGMMKASDLLKSEPHFILYNVDVACDMDIREIYQHHVESGNMATLAVMDRQSTRKLVFDSRMNLCGWKNYTTGETRESRSISPMEKPREYAFSGISVVSREIFPLVEETGKFSITNLFLRLAASQKIGGYAHQGRWADLGTVEKLQLAKAMFSGT